MGHYLLKNTFQRNNKYVHEYRDFAKMIEYITKKAPTHSSISKKTKNIFSQTLKQNE